MIRVEPLHPKHSEEATRAKDSLERVFGTTATSEGDGAWVISEPPSCPIEELNFVMSLHVGAVNFQRIIQ